MVFVKAVLIFSNRMKILILEATKAASQVKLLHVTFCFNILQQRHRKHHSGQTWSPQPQWKNCGHRIQTWRLKWRRYDTDVKVNMQELFLCVFDILPKQKENIAKEEAYPSCHILVDIMVGKMYAFCVSHPLRL